VAPWATPSVPIMRPPTGALRCSVRCRSRRTQQPLLSASSAALPLPAHLPICRCGIGMMVRYWSSGLARYCKRHASDGFLSLRNLR
jgi:hypothetical protein